MKAVIFSFTEKGAQLSQQIKQIMHKSGYAVDCFTPNQYARSSLTTVVADNYATCAAIIFVGACGIAVRAIAPFIQDKRTDPAVICLDEKGRHVIPILSGHIGGANGLACLIAQEIRGTAVITTATDINELLSVDQWAVKNNLYIGDITTAKKISVSLLAGKTIGLVSDFKIVGEIPNQISLNCDCEAGICISLDEFKQPFNTTLDLIPRVVYIGLGCRKGIQIKAIEELIFAVLAKKKISLQALAGIATIDLKEQEQGLLEFSTKYSLPITFYTAEELAGVAGSFTGSDFVKTVVGVENVCERAAVLVSQNGQLVSAKAQKDGVTVALAMKNWKVSFKE